MKKELKKEDWEKEIKHTEECMRGIGCSCDHHRIIHFFRKYINDTLFQSRQELLKSLKEKLMKTKDSNSAFMTMRNGKGEIIDWMLPVSEVIKLLEEEIR